MEGEVSVGCSRSCSGPIPPNRDLDQTAIDRDPRSFLYTTAKRLAIDYLRQRDRVLLRSGQLDQALTVPASTPDAETALDAKRRLTVVLRAINELPAKRRAVFVMFKFQHKSYGDIARELGISIRTVENHLTKAMAYCRARFEALDGADYL